MSTGYKRPQYKFYVLSKLKRFDFHDAPTAEEIIQKCQGFKPWYDENCSGQTIDFDSCIRGTLSSLKEDRLITDKGGHPSEYYLSDDQKNNLDFQMVNCLVELDSVFDFDPQDGTFSNTNMNHMIIFGYDEEVEQDYLKYVRELIPN